MKMTTKNNATTNARPTFGQTTLDSTLTNGKPNPIQDDDNCDRVTSFKEHDIDPKVDDKILDINALIIQAVWAKYKERKAKNQQIQQKRHEEAATKIQSTWSRFKKQKQREEEEETAELTSEAAATNDEETVKCLIDSLNIDSNDEGHCRQLLRQLMAIYSPTYNTYLKMTMPARLFAKISKVDWLVVVMQEHTEEIDCWDGKGDVPKARHMKKDFLDAFKAFYDDERRKNALDIAGLTEADDPVPKLPPASTPIDWVRHARNAYNEIRHCMPKGSTREEVHAVVLKELSRCSSKPAFEQKLRNLFRDLHKKKYPELWQEVLTRPKQSAASSDVIPFVSNLPSAESIANKHKTAAATAESPNDNPAGGRNLRKKLSSRLPAASFAAPARKGMSARGKGGAIKRKTRASSDEYKPPTKKPGVGNRLVYDRPSDKWLQDRLERNNYQQLFVNFLFASNKLDPGELVYHGFGAAISRPDGTTDQEWEKVAEAHTRLVVLATGAIHLEPTFFRGARLRGFESVSLSKVTHTKWRSSTGTWVPEGMCFGAQQASFATLLTQEKTPQQHIFYRDLIKKKFPTDAAKMLFADMAAILRCYSLFAVKDPVLSTHTMPKIKLDEGVAIFEDAERALSGSVI